MDEKTTGSVNTSVSHFYGSVKKGKVDKFNRIRMVTRRRGRSIIEERQRLYREILGLCSDSQI